MHSPSIIDVEYRGRVAILTIDNQSKLNALNEDQYHELAQKMLEVAEHDEVFITVLIGKGRFFSSGADVTSSLGRPSASSSPPPSATNPITTTTPTKHEARRALLQSFVVNNLNLTRAFYTHPKVLVAALNGPVVGLTAAVVAHADFVYAAPHAYLLTPFASLGLVAEGGASRALVRRLGPARAAEALLMSRRIAAPELKEAGFVNAIFDVEDGGGGGGPDDAFRERVLKEVDERLGDHLNGESLLGIKRLMKAQDVEELERANVQEVFAGLERLVKGVPQEEFRKIASGQKRHKL